MQRLFQWCLGKKAPEPELAWKYRWKSASRTALNRYVLYDKENEMLRRLRDQDLINPAPFTHQTLVALDGMGAPDFEKPFDYQHYESDSMKWIEERANVPVTKIIGLGCIGNLDNYSHGMTFREVLFESLHGDGITEESVKFLVGPDNKDQKMPHKFNCDNPKSRSAGGISISQYGDWFVVNNGQQRSIIAMYAIWQQYGDTGTLQNVTISRRVQK